MPPIAPGMALWGILFCCWLLLVDLLLRVADWVRGRGNRWSELWGGGCVFGWKKSGGFWVARGVFISGRRFYEGLFFGILKMRCGFAEGSKKFRCG